MPVTEVVFFAEVGGGCPLIDWMDRLPEKARVKCIVRVERLAQGHDFTVQRLISYEIHSELQVALRAIQYRCYISLAEEKLLCHNYKQTTVLQGINLA
jgi:hypothetical protein